MITINAEDVWCPVCRRQPGRECKGDLAKMQIDHDGETACYGSRIRRADALIDHPDRNTWRKDELATVVLPLVRNGGLVREGRINP